jgi:hypothetical protein
MNLEAEVMAEEISAVAAQEVNSENQMILLTIKR